MKKILLAALTIGALAFTATAEDKKDEKKAEYPLKKCLVADEPLGSMGKPYVTKLEGKEVQLCCKGCEKDLKKDSKKYLKKLEDETKKANAAKK